MTSFINNSCDQPPLAMAIGTNSLAPRLPRPSAKDSLVFKFFWLHKPCDFGGWVGGVSQTNGISWLIWKYFPAIPLLNVFLK